MDEEIDLVDLVTFPGHTASKWQSWDLNLGSQFSEPMFELLRDVVFTMTDESWSLL